MIAKIEDIIKAQARDDEPVRNNGMNGLTRLNNEIVRLQVQDSLGLEFFKDIEGSAGYDD